MRSRPSSMTRTHSVTRTFAVVVGLLLVVPACSCRKTDAERAKEEREKIEQQLRQSLVLFPYRLLKLSVRSSTSPKRPAAVDAVMALVRETEALPSRPATAGELAHEAATWALLVKALYEARETMMTRDEDEFPTLTETFLSSPLPPPWDPQVEHLALATLWFIVDAADRAHHVPGGTEYVFYELARATPQPGWPADVRRFAQLLRGAAFCATDHHYAAEEELSTVLVDLEAAHPPDFSSWAHGEVTAEEAFHAFRATGFFLRAWNRMGLEREEPAADDLEKGLAELKAIGVDNELTQWGWAVVHAHRGRYADAAVELDTLASSPNLDGATKQELAEASKAMRSNGKGIPVLLQTRAMWIVGQALLARSGGVEHILVTLLGEEDGKRLALPVTWLERARRALSQSPGAVLDKGRALGSTGLEALQKWAGETRAVAADAGAP